MIVETISNISERYITKFRPCIKCRLHPIIKSYFDDVSGDKWSYITCPNENCDNKINFNDHLSRLVEVWNSQNDPENPIITGIWKSKYSVIESKDLVLAQLKSPSGEYYKTGRFLKVDCSAPNPYGITDYKLMFVSTMGRDFELFEVIRWCYIKDIK